MAANDRPAGLRRWLAILPLCWLCLICFSACGALDSDRQKIALLAPFEGLYRALGYNALLSARLAFADSGAIDLQLLPVDDGGSARSALERVKALNRDAQVALIIALGPQATHPMAQAANDKAMILIGNWGHDRAADDSFYATARDLASAHGDGDLRIYEALHNLNGSNDERLYSSSAAPASDSFVQRFAAGDPQQARPNWLATLINDVTRLALRSVLEKRDLLQQSLDGVNGVISFEDGYWRSAPMHRYRVLDGSLIALAD